MKISSVYGYSYFELQQNIKNRLMRIFVNLPLNNNIIVNILMLFSFFILLNVENIY